MPPKKNPRNTDYESPKKNPRHTDYECPRCGYATDRFSAYRLHAGRLNMCAPTKSDVMPTIENVITRVTRNFRSADGAPCTVTNVSGAHSHVHMTNTTNNTTHNTTNNNTTNNTVNDNSHNTNANININIYNLENPYTPELNSFPLQDRRYMPPQFKADISKLAANDPDGFQKALHEMFRVAYFSTARPYNINVFILRPGDEALVLGPNRQWAHMDSETAVRKMIEQQVNDIDFIREDVSDTLTQEDHQAIDNGYNNNDSYMSDPRLQSDVKERAMSFADPLSHIVGAILELVRSRASSTSPSTANQAASGGSGSGVPGP